MSNDTTVLFGLSDVRVQHVDLGVDGRRTVHAETNDSSAAGCPSCGVISTAVKGNVTTALRDIHNGETEISVVLHKQRWRCEQVECGRGSFTETIGEVPAGARTTGRLRRAMGAAVADAARSVAEVALSFGVSWPTAHAAVIELAERVLGEPEPVVALGVDETRRGRPRWTFSVAEGRWGRTDAWDTGFVDLHGSGGLLGVPVVIEQDRPLARRWLSWFGYDLGL